MYAIRSYYDINNDKNAGYNYNQNERFPNPDQSLNKYSFNGHINYLKDDIDLNRITSYNVCYTKLLRFLLKCLKM